MELVQRIKNAEQEARQIVEKAKQATAELIEQAKREEEEARKQAQQKRREAIAHAVSEAEQSGQNHGDRLLAEGQQQIEDLRRRARGRMDGCVSKVAQQLQR